MENPPFYRARDYQHTPLEMSRHVRTRLRARPGVSFCLVFERERLSVPAMRQVLGDTLRRLGVSEESVADILLAASEACTNVVLHAGQSVRAYEVTAFVNGRDCHVEVRDSGLGTPPLRGSRGVLRAASLPFAGGSPREDGGRVLPMTMENRVVPPGEMAESGRGFAVMRGCVDGVTLRSAPGRGTRVVLHKRIRRDAPLPLPA